MTYYVLLIAFIAFSCFRLTPGEGRNFQVAAYYILAYFSFVCGSIYLDLFVVQPLDFKHVFGASFHVVIFRNNF